MYIIKKSIIASTVVAMLSTAHSQDLNLASSEKNKLATAIKANIANTVNLNSDGLGQVLVYPYYTVNNDLNTLISVVNTTDKVKAVKVRFLEGKNSRDCLSFNLYLSPYDVWTAALSATTATEEFAGSYYADDETVRLTTFDTSCTGSSSIASADGISPGGSEFLPWGFDPQGNGIAADGYDHGGRDLQRCTEGHFEIIDMGTVVDTESNGNAASAVDHGTGGVPANCDTITSNWDTDGAWTADSTDGVVAPDGVGGLFGSVAIIDVVGGTNISYNADAIQGYSDSVQHTKAGDLAPNLGTGSTNVSHIFAGSGIPADVTWNVDSIQAVSALYMYNKIYGEYVLTDSIGANTEWVVTFPTKFAYVDPNIAYRFADNSGPYEPFTSMFTDANGGSACEEYDTKFWNREEQLPITPDHPPPPEMSIPSFCWATNVLELHDYADIDDALPTAILGSNLATHFQTLENNTPDYFDTGWLRISFNQATNDNVTGITYTGLPVTGFAVQRYVNGSLGDDNILANYAGVFQHRYSRLITSDQ